MAPFAEAFVPAWLALAARSLPGFELETLPDRILHASPALLLLACVSYYAGFPLRGLRWRLLLRNAGSPVGLSDATEILFLSWLVNCLVPAKLGDVYRAHLLKLNASVSFGRTLGTVFAERVLDLLAIGFLGMAAASISFRGNLPPTAQVVFVVGIAVVGALTGGLVMMRSFGRRLIRLLPVSERVVGLYERFEDRVFSSAGRRATLPSLVVLTVLIWATEVTHLLLVV